MEQSKTFDVVVSSSKEYINPLLTMLYSLFRNNHHIFRIWFLGDIADSCTKKLVKLASKYNSLVNFVPIDNSIFLGAPNYETWLRGYYKIMIPWVLPDDVDYCLWLDSDIIVRKDISGIFNYINDDDCILGCSHKYKMDKDKINGSYVGKKPYINSGVILFNIKLIRKKISIDEYFTYFTNYKHEFKYADQDFFNGFFGNMLFIINSPIYNSLVDSSRIFFLQPFKRSKIAHYYFFIKPWKTISYPLFPFFCYWRYAYRFFGIKKALLFQLLFLFYFPLRATKRVLKKIISN